MALEAGAQYTYLDYYVTENDFELLVDDLQLQGERLNDARALWGPLYFNQNRGVEASIAFERWSTQWWEEWAEIIGGWEPDPAVWDDKRHRAMFRLEQRRLTARFFDQLVAIAPHGAPIIESQRRATRRRAMWRLRIGQSQRIPGATFDLFEVMADLQRQHPELPIAPGQWSPAVQDILLEYEITLDEFLVRYDRVYLMIENRELRLPVPESVNERQGWIETMTLRWMEPNEVILGIRNLQKSTVELLAHELPGETSEQFLNEAQARISPFAYKKLKWEFWMHKALAQRDLEDDMRAALEELERGFVREKQSRARQLVESFAAQYLLEDLEAANRRDAQRLAGLRDDMEESSQSEADYERMLETYRDFDERTVQRIRRVLGARADSMAGAVLSQIKYQEEELRWEKFTTANRLGNEAQDEEHRPRQRSPFLTASEFSGCMDRIAFAEDQRRNVFAVLYDDFRESFVAARDDYDQRRLVALKKDRQENLTPEQRAYKVSSQAHFDEWNRRWLELRRRIEGEFSDQVRLFLSDEEHRIWLQEIRRMHRLRVIPRMLNYIGRAQGVFCHDLIQVIEAAGFYENADDDLRELLDALETNIDDALTDFEDRDTKMGREYYALQEEFQQTPSERLRRKLDRVGTEWKRIRGRIVALRFQYVPMIVEVMEEIDRERFLDTLHRAEFPWLYGESMADRVVAALRRDRVLNEERLSLLATIEEQYFQAREEFRRDYLALIPRYLIEKDQERRSKMLRTVYDTATRRTKLDRDVCIEIRDLFNVSEIDGLCFDIRLLLSSFNEP